MAGSDTELLRLCSLYLATVGQADVGPLQPRRDADPSWHTAIAISRITAQTAEGVIAKARVIQRHLRDAYGLEGAYGNPEPRFCNDAEMCAMWSLLGDLLAGAA